MNLIEVREGVVPEWMCVEAVRLMNLQLRMFGLTHEDYESWQQNAWPWLQENDVMRGLGWRVGLAFSEREAPAIQIIWHLPDLSDHAETTMHQDVPDKGMVFTRIVGLALTDWTNKNGSPFWRDNTGATRQVLLTRGDAYSMHPATWHTASFNLADMPRCGLYLRWQRPA